MSQEWDEVLYEINLMLRRLDAFRDDLKAAASGGKLTGEQCEIVHDITKAASAYCRHVRLRFTPGRR